MPRLLMPKLFALLSLLPGLASAEIYRWTDAEGRVHFAQQPGAGAERVEVAPQVIERDHATREREASAATFFAARREEQAQAQEKAAQAHAKASQECTQWQQQREQLERGRLFFRTDERGERQYYSDAEVVAARRQLEARINQSCR